MTDKNADKKTQQSGLAMVLLRNAFYHDSYAQAVIAVLLVFLLDIFLLIAVVYKYFHPPAPQYFPTNPQYQLIKWHPLSDPVFSNSEVLQWTADAVKKAFNLDFMHWRAQLQDASYNFTSNGWGWFIDSLKRSGNLKTLVKLQMVSNATITGAPSKQKTAVLNGRYTWVIELPLMVSYINMNKTINMPWKVTVVVQRVPVQTNKNRIAINNFLIVPQEQDLQGG